MKIYLDTCVISNFVRSDANPADVEALTQIVNHAQSGKLTLCSSTVALEEINKIPEQYRGPHLAKYNTLNTIKGSTAWLDENCRTPDEHPNFHAFSNILPDCDDVRHLWLAKESGIKNFVTTDERTILSKHSEIKAKFDMDVYSPSSLLKTFGA